MSCLFDAILDNWKVVVARPKRAVAVEPGPTEQECVPLMSLGILPSDCSVSKPFLFQM